MLDINKIYCGNCEDILLSIDSNSIDLIVTSPPYDTIRDYKGFTFNFNNISTQLFRVLTEGGVLVWVVNDETIDGSESTTSFKSVIHFKDEVGFKLHDTMIYEKNSPSFPARKTGNRYSQIFEFMFVLSKGKPKTHNLL